MAQDIEHLSDEEFDAYMNKAIATDELPEDDDVEVESEEDEVEVDDTEDEEEIDDEVNEEDLEQPEDSAESEDSDDDNTEDDEDEDEAEEDSEEDEPANKSEDEEPTEESTEEAPTEEKVPTYQMKANGMEFEFTPDELIALAQKGMDYTKKTQQIKPWREVISALEEKNLGKDEVNLMIDVLSGDKDAIAQVIKKAGIDPLDLDIEAGNYVPKNYGRNSVELEISDVLESIAKDPEYRTTSYIVEKDWDDASREAFVKDPNMIAALHVDVKNGNYDKVAPRMLKKKALDGGRKSDIEYYIEAGAEYHAEQRAKRAEEAAKAEQARKIEEVKSRTVKQTTIKKAAKKRKAAATTKPAGKTNTVVDYLDDDLSDEEFSKLMEKQIRQRK